MSNALRRKTIVARNLLQALKELQSSVVPLVYNDTYEPPTRDQVLKAREATKNAREAIEKAGGGEVMEVEPGWFRMRNGEIAYVCGISPLGLAIGWNRLSTIFTWSAKHGGRRFESREDEYDLIEHLPDCTGFAWVET